jgi:hypothetical protein
LDKPGLLRFRLRVDRKSTSARDIVWLSVEIWSIFAVIVDRLPGGRGSETHSELRIGREAVQLFTVRGY